MSLLSLLSLLISGLPAARADEEIPPDPPAPRAGAVSALAGTSVGGYGQVVAAWSKVGPEGPYTGVADLQRFVVFVGHDFSAQGLPIRSYAELEWEHAIACDGCSGAVEAEQAFVEWEVAGQALAVRAGLVLVPIGLINEGHDPPTFHGVERPSTELRIIPSTWRELGVGLTGRRGVARYALYALTPLDPSGLGPEGLVGARTGGSFSPARTAAGAGRLEVEPVLGLSFGLSGYGAELGSVRDTFDAAGERLKLSIPVYGGSIDGRFRRWGLEARVLGTAFWLPQSDDWMEARREDGSPWVAEGAGAIPTRMQGGYVELAWNVLFFSDSSQQLLPFARLEAYDPQAAVPDGMERDPALNVQEGTFGLGWRPIPALAIKADVQLRDRQYGEDELRWNLGVGWLF